MAPADYPSPEQLAVLDDTQLVELGRNLKHEHLRRRQAYRTCEQCGNVWLARADARYCTSNCRLTAFRDRRKATRD